MKKANTSFSRRRRMKKRSATIQKRLRRKRIEGMWREKMDLEPTTSLYKMRPAGSE